MNYEETVCRLKEEFARRFSHAEITISSRMVNGKKRVYVKTVGAYKVESGRLIECHFEDIERVYEDYNTLTYKYRGKV